MPWKLVKSGNSYKVIKKDTGKTVAGNKTKLSKERASAVMRALYARAD